MAKFFGLFNYEKEGPGVSKDEVPKRGIFAFFETFFSFFWKLVVADCWYVLLSLPIISGLGCCGITNVVRSVCQKKHSFGTSDFFDTIKKNWKQGLAAGIINLIFDALIMLAGWYYFSGMMGTKQTFSLYSLGFAAILFAALVFAMMKFYLWNLIITFKFKLSTAYKNSFKLAFAGMKRTLIIIAGLVPFYALTALLFYLASAIPFVSILISLITLFVFPVFRMYLIQYNVFPVIRKFIIDPYYALRPDDDIELRKNLGVYEEPEDDDEDDEDTVFVDRTVKKEDE